MCWCLNAQALLLWTQMVLFYWYTMTLFWSPATSTTAKLHLRVLMALKSLSFTFSALQLRNGYPPPASYRYQGSTMAFFRPSHVTFTATMSCPARRGLSCRAISVMTEDVPST